MQRLEPSESGLNAFFSFESHTKVVMTERIAYVGSANFSEESKHNRETGVIVRDPALVQQIWDRLVPLLEGEAVQFFGGSLLEEKRILFALALSRLGGLTTRLEDALFSCQEVGPYTEHYGYNHVDPALSLTILEDLIEILDILHEERCALEAEGRLPTIAALIDSDRLELVRGLIDESRPMYRLAAFDPSNEADTRSKEAIASMPEGWEPVWQHHYSEAISELGDLAEAAEDDVNGLLAEERRLLSDLEGALTEVGRLKRLEATIDNTR